MKKTDGRKSTFCWKKPSTSSTEDGQHSKIEKETAPETPSKIAPETPSKTALETAKSSPPTAGVQKQPVTTEGAT